MAASHKTADCEILIVGAGIAGLWLFHRLKRAGYDALLITDKGIGAGQTISSQGIIHSGLKYTLAGKVNDLAKSISQMPNRWRDAMNGKGEVDLTNAKALANSQSLMIPPGIAGNLIKIATEKTFGDSVKSATSPYPNFEGSVLDMGEMVLDIPSVIRALAEPYKDSIRAFPAEAGILNNERCPLPRAKQIVYTAAASNLNFAEQNNHDDGLKTQHRPLVMGLIKNAPFPLYAHFVGASDKPVATVTTHKTKDGKLVWYLGGLVAEKTLDTNPNEIYNDARKAFTKYLPGLDTSNFEWSTLPIDRIEGKSGIKNWMPDTPTIHQAGNSFYCYPTKLTFAPMLSDMIIERLDIKPSGQQSDFSSLPAADYEQAPWDEAKWTKLN